VGYSMVNKLYDNDEAKLFTNHPKPVKKAGLCLMLNKKKSQNKERIKRFNNGLKNLRVSGKIKQFTDESRSGNYKN